MYGILASGFRGGDELNYALSEILFEHLSRCRDGKGKPSGIDLGMMAKILS